MKEPASLRNRLIVAATAWIAFGMVLAWLILSNVFRVHVTQQFYDELFVHIAELQRLAHVENGRAVLSADLSDPRYDVENSGFYWEIQQQGNVLARSPSMKAAPLKTPPDERSDVGIHTHRIAGPTGELLVAESLEWKDPGKPPVQFIIGTDKRHLDDVVASFNNALSWSLTGLGLSMVVAAALLILYAMRPLGQLNTSLYDVRSGKLKRMPGSFPSEVQPLVDNLNAMLSSVTELIQRARTQAGNIAHGLKTPLAILTDEAYRLQQQGLDTSACTILDQCRKMQTQIDYQTTRARVVASRLSPGAAADVGRVASDVVAALSRIYAHRGLQFEVDVSDSLHVACEVQDLQEILGNLIDNAGKHAKSRVRVAAGAVAGSLIDISISDDGPGLPPEAHEVVFNVGERWDTQSAGSGLGLSIARDLVTLYGGTINLAQSSLGGLKASIHLPAAR
ncbi:HAMP domain-containing sensor histidine kinase [Hyphomicrobium sp. CS1GBMeth3]|uniref:ATP-binding protein n=1 Tax=Hyphomicrobium sp. CS1GBMeth3 TaxID=1892845 RepID=UPI000932067E|nr:HAMP domain-containing sensor histidine kinase [Hyphomicrobium sp. CS1GBMeth3]